MEPLLSDVSQEINGLYSALYGVNTGWKMLDRLQTTLAYRTTSSIDDEALCLASFLGLDSANFVGLSHQDGMEDVHPGLLFTGRPRINVAGARWMPQTVFCVGGI